MFDLIKKAIGCKNTAVPHVVCDERKVELLAAVFLLEAAHSDYHCSEDELLHVVETVKSVFRLSGEYVEELIEFAKSERGNATDIYQFSRQANEQMSRAQKLAILDAVWRVIYIDGKINKYEEHFARKLTNLLWLDHKDFINAKLKARPS
ncbi:MAG TPA: TerB family tellurite resistance protein [Thermodesulfovibrionales bacterium]|nr:TerB family tellurite resistance protein [Thermodesulfovibrionales bacterium]